MSKEIQQIIEKISTFAPDEKAILATVVDVEGSGYRRPGARMLIDRKGYGIGTISGGCLESDVLERAKKVFATGEPTVITYDTTADENSVFGLGMGCRGIVRILLEIVSKDSFLFNYAADAIADRTIFSLATEVSAQNGAKTPGRRLYFNEDGVVSGEFERDETTELFTVMRPALYERRTGIEKLTFGEIFIETIAPPIELKLFGAGFDALPLIKIAKELGWRVAVVDHRPAFAGPESPRASRRRFQLVYSRAGQKVFRRRKFRRRRDDAQLRARPRNSAASLKTNFRYVGALGPKSRTERILAEAGADFSAGELSKLYAPVGLDIGADTPEAIALSIVAEIQAVLKQREGGFLRERKGSIYGRHQE